tara:strand:+ start:39 stop:248 length:210 start_codon:yes stop_codon:yes gene_type:complete
MKILIEIDLDNAAFDEEEDNHGNITVISEAQRILSAVTSFGPWNKNLKDINGNTVGSFKLVDDEGRVLS